MAGGFTGEQLVFIHVKCTRAVDGTFTLGSGGSSSIQNTFVIGGGGNSNEYVIAFPVSNNEAVTLALSGESNAVIKIQVFSGIQGLTVTGS